MEPSETVKSNKKGVIAMLNNKKYRKMIAVLTTVLVLATGCSNGNEQNENGGQVIEEPQNGQNTPNPSEDANPSEDEQGDQDNEGDDTLPEEPGDTEVSKVEEIASRIISGLEMGTTIKLGDQEIKDMYGIDRSKLADGIFLPSMFNISASEIAIVQLASEEQYDEVVQGMEQRAKQIQQSFEFYLPDQYQLSLNYQIIRNGNFVMFSITHDQDRAKEIFDRYTAE